MDESTNKCSGQNTNKKKKANGINLPHTSDQPAAFRQMEKNPSSISLLQQIVSTFSQLLHRRDSKGRQSSKRRYFCKELAPPTYEDRKSEISPCGFRLACTFLPQGSMAALRQALALLFNFYFIFIAFRLALVSFLFLFFYYSLFFCFL